VRKARPIAALIASFESGDRPTPDRPWAQLSAVERRQLVDDHRLAYVSQAPVNWCPGLGTVLANEEVTPGRAQRARQLPGLPAQPEAVDDADHRVRGIGWSTTWTRWTGRSRSS